MKLSNWQHHSFTAIVWLTFLFWWTHSMHNKAKKMSLCQCTASVMFISLMKCSSIWSNCRMPTKSAMTSAVRSCMSAWSLALNLQIKLPNSISLPNTCPALDLLSMDDHDELPYLAALSTVALVVDFMLFQLSSSSEHSFNFSAQFCHCAFSHIDLEFPPIQLIARSCSIVRCSRADRQCQSMLNSNQSRTKWVGVQLPQEVPCCCRSRWSTVGSVSSFETDQWNRISRQKDGTWQWADKKMCGVVLEELNNSCLAKKDNCPTSVDGAGMLLSHHQGHRFGVRNVMDDNTGLETGFAQLNRMSKLRCCECNKLGHARTVCPKF